MSGRLLWLGGLALVGGLLGYGARGVLSRDDREPPPMAPGSNLVVGRGPEAPGTNLVRERLLRRTGPPVSPLRASRVDGGDDPTALIGRARALEEPAATDATNFTARNLATTVLQRLQVVDGEETLRACLERGQAAAPLVVRVELAMTASEDAVVLRGVRLLDVDATVAAACVARRVRPGVREERHASLPALLPYDGIIVEALTLPEE